MSKCDKCGRHKERIKIVQIDPKTKKKWYILTCPDCGYESDIEEFKTYKNASDYSDSSYFLPAPRQGFDESEGQDDDSEGLSGD